MARPRKKDSKYSVGGLGLKPEEDKVLIQLIEKHDISIAQLCRALVRQWIVEGGEGLLKYSKK
jgi:hypothetical protein